MTRNKLVLLLNVALFATGCGNQPLGSRDGGIVDSPADQPADQPADTGDGGAGSDLVGSGGAGGSAAPDGPDGDDGRGDDVPPPPVRPLEVAAWEDQMKLAPGVRITLIRTARRSNAVLAGTTAGDVFTATDWHPDVPSWSAIDNFKTAGSGAFQMPNLPVSGLVSHPNDGAKIWVGFFGTDGVAHKVWWTQSAGQFWTELTESPTENIRSLSINPFEMNTLYAVTTNLVLRSTDLGANWQWWTPDATDPHLEGARNITAVAFAPNTERVWTGDMDGAVWFSDVPDAGTNNTQLTWTSAGGGTPPRRVNGLFVAVDDLGEHVALACDSLASDGVWLSDNGGQTWRTGHGAGLPAVMTVFSVSINPRFPSTLYAFTSAGAFRSDDAGATWW